MPHSTPSPPSVRPEGGQTFLPQAQSTNLELLVLTSFEAAVPFAREWDQLAIRLNAPIYMSFDWLKTWWAFYGGKSSLRLLLARQGGELVAALPCYLDSFGFAPLSTTVARLVGAHLPPKTFNPPVALDYASEFLAKAVHHLLCHDQVDLIALGPVSNDWSASPILAGLHQFHPQRVPEVSFVPSDSQTLFHLPRSFDEFLASMDPGERKSRLKRLRQLERTCLIQDDVLDDPHLVPSEFEQFSSMHAAQWRSQGKGGHFEAWPKALDYNRALVKTLSRDRKVRFFRLLADGQVISNRYTFSFGSTLFSELPARTVGEPWDKRGIGISSLIRFTGHAIRSGYSTIDSGLGTYEHKSSIGGTQITVGSFRIKNPKARSRLASLLFLTSSCLFTLFGLKLWYRRIVPRMPSRFPRQQPLSALRRIF